MARFLAGLYRVGIVMADTPLTNLSTVVVSGLQQGRQRGPALLEEQISEFRAVARAAFASAPGVASGDQPVATRPTNGRRCMSIGEDHPFFGQAIHMGCVDFGVRVVAGDIAIAEIIQVDEKDVGFRTGGGPCERAQQKDPG